MRNTSQDDEVRQQSQHECKDFGKAEEKGADGRHKRLDGVAPDNGRIKESDNETDDGEDDKRRYRRSAHEEQVFDDA